MTIATSKDRTVFLFIRIVESFDFSFFFFLRINMPSKSIVLNSVFKRMSASLFLCSSDKLNIRISQNLPFVVISSERFTTIFFLKIFLKIRPTVLRIT